MRSFRRLSVLTAVLAVLATACGGAGSGDPADELVEAFERTLDGSFAWEAKVQLGDAFASDQGVPPQTIGMIESARLNGVRTPGTASVEFSLSGIRLFEFRGLDEGRSGYFRTGIAQAAQVFGGVSPEDLAADAGLTQLPPEFRDLFDALFAGEWLGFEDIDLERLEEQQQELYEQFGEDFGRFGELREQLEAEFRSLPELLRKVTAVTEEGGRYRIDLLTEPIVREAVRIFRPFVEQMAQSFGGPPLDDADLEADIQELLAEAPERLRGLSVQVQDGLVHEVRFDVGELIADLPDVGEDAPQPGDLVILLTLAEHGTVDAVEAPDDARVFTQQELLELQEMLLDSSMFVDPATMSTDEPDSQAALAFPG